VSTSHIAGIVVGIESADIWIQRCAMCGEVLQDLHPSRCAFESSDDHTLPQFAVGGVYRVTDGNPTQFIFLGDFNDLSGLPNDFCLPLVEREP